MLKSRYHPTEMGRLDLDMDLLKEGDVNDIHTAYLMGRFGSVTDIIEYDYEHNFYSIYIALMFKNKEYLDAVSKSKYINLNKTIEEDLERAKDVPIFKLCPETLSFLGDNKSIQEYISSLDPKHVMYRIRSHDYYYLTPETIKFLQSLNNPDVDKYLQQRNNYINGLDERPAVVKATEEVVLSNELWMIIFLSLDVGDMLSAGSKHIPTFQGPNMLELMEVSSKFYDVLSSKMYRKLLINHNIDNTNREFINSLIDGTSYSLDNLYSVVSLIALGGGLCPLVFNFVTPDEYIYRCMRGGRRDLLEIKDYLIKDKRNNPVDSLNCFRLAPKYFGHKMHLRDILYLFEMMGVEPFGDCLDCDLLFWNIFRDVTVDDLLNDNLLIMIAMIRDSPIVNDSMLSYCVQSYAKYFNKEWFLEWIWENLGSDGFSEPSDHINELDKLMRYYRYSRDPNHIKDINNLFGLLEKSLNVKIDKSLYNDDMHIDWICKYDADDFSNFIFEMVIALIDSLVCNNEWNHLIKVISSKLFLKCVEKCNRDKNPRLNFLFEFVCIFDYVESKTKRHKSSSLFDLAFVDLASFRYKTRYDHNNPINKLNTQLHKSIQNTPLGKMFTSYQTINTMISQFESTISSSDFINPIIPQDNEGTATQSSIMTIDSQLVMIQDNDLFQALTKSSEMFNLIGILDKMTEPSP